MYRGRPGYPLTIGQFSASKKRSRNSMEWWYTPQMVALSNHESRRVGDGRGINRNRAPSICLPIWRGAAGTDPKVAMSSRAQCSPKTWRRKRRRRLSLECRTKRPRPPRPLSRFLLPFHNSNHHHHACLTTSSAVRLTLPLRRLAGNARRMPSRTCWLSRVGRGRDCLFDVF